MERPCGGMTQLVGADTPQKAQVVDLRKVQKDGVVVPVPDGGPRQVCRILGAPIECLQELIDGNFLLWFDGVAVLTHFRLANTLQNDRIKQLRYPEIAKQIYIQPNRIYTLTPGKKQENLFYTKEKNIRAINRKSKQLLESKRNPKGNKPNLTQSNTTQSNLIQSNLTKSNLSQSAVGGGLPDAPERDGWAATCGTDDDNKDISDISRAIDDRPYTESCQIGDVGAVSDRPPEAPERTKKENVLRLSMEQLQMLYDRIGFMTTMRYADKLCTFIRDHNANIKDHYATILKWWEEDGGTYL